MYRNISLDILKLVLSFFIIGLHSNFLIDLNLTLNYFTVNGLFRIAVPIFFIINGFFFLEVIEKQNFKKWIKRIFLLYSFWMLFYIYAWFRIKNLNFDEIFNLIKTIFFGYGHLWYIIAMLQAALLLSFCDKLSILKLFVLAISLFLIGLTLQYVYSYQIVSTINVTNGLGDNIISRNFLFFAFPFVTIGYIINKTGLHKKISNKYLFIGIIFSLIVLIFENQYNYLNAVKEDFDLLFSLLIICPLVFMLIYKFTYRKKTKIIGLYANAIYFIHIIILSLLGRLSVFEGTSKTFITIILSIVFATILIKINKKLKFIL